MQYLYSIFILVFAVSMLVSPASVSAFWGDRFDIDSRIDEIHNRVDGLLEGKFVQDQVIVKRTGSDVFEVQKLPRGRSLRDRLVELNLDSSIEYAEPDYIAEAFFTPNDPYYNLQWNLENSAESGDIHMKEAWDISKGAGAIVAIVDTGIAYENYGSYKRAPDLAGTSFVPGYDFINFDSHPNDDHGHGTHVAGTVAQSTNNSLGTAGVAPDASLMPVKVLSSSGSGSYSAVANGIRFAADNGAHVINMSLGGSSSSQAMEDAVAYAHGKGVAIFAASGNNGRSTISYPGAYDDYVITIGSTDYDQKKVSYSNYGDELDFVAPGGDTSDDDNDDGQPDGILQQTLYQTWRGVDVGRFGYYFYQGTSMATPHAAGVGALLVSLGVTSPSEIENILANTAEDLDSDGWDDRHGWGLINAHAALIEAQGGGGSGDPEPDPDPEPEPEPDPEPTDEPPSVSISSPSPGSEVSETVSFAANASDDNGVVSVKFYIDNVLVKTDTSSPYSYSWNTTEGSDGAHELKTIAEDTVGQTAENSHSVTVNNPDLESEPELGLPDMSLSALTTNNPRDGRTFRVKPTVENNSNSAQSFDLHIELFTPSGDPLFWFGDGMFSESLSAGDDNRYNYRTTAPSRTPELNNYLARVTLLYDDEILDVIERTFRVR